MLRDVGGTEAREAGEAGRRRWAADDGVEDAAAIVDEAGIDVVAVERAAADSTMVLLGANERGLLSRLVTDSLHLQVGDGVDASGLLAERPADRSVVDRLFGASGRDR